MTRLDRRLLFTTGAAAALLAASGLSPEVRPRPGGRLRLAVPREDDALGEAMRGAVFDTLTEIGPDGALRPELAVTWQRSEDARSWWIDLREGVTFHDGGAFGARDVAASLQAHDMPGLIQAEVVGTHRLRLDLATGDSGLPFRLADRMLTMRPADRAADAANLVGTGLYRARRWQEGRHFLGGRVASHYRDGQAGWVDSVEVVVIPDAAVRAEALRDGYVDVAALPLADGLRSARMARGDYVFHPSDGPVALAARRDVGVPRVIGARSILDDGRIAQRWWMT